MLKKRIFLAAILLTICLHAQEKKYQSLLWEISGNGLKKSSYLYGSMHVSDKVSYHLSDAFFSHIMQADIIANETDPTTWHEVNELANPKNNLSNYNQYFYSTFYQNQLIKKQLYPLFIGDNFKLSNMLTRSNERNQNYEEETYLDMFIYRIGKKYGKKTLGLENTKTSIKNIMKAAANDNIAVQDNKQQIKKILKDKRYNQALTDFYRDNDLDMIDSLTTLTYSKIYLKAILYDRNIVMANSMDSIMPTGSLFATIGAAHLPGKKGVIELLRNKGYKVVPIHDPYTINGKKTKQQIENYFAPPELQITTTTDGMISLPLFTTVIEDGENLLSPDLTNGGYINVKRTNLNDCLNKNNTRFKHETLDSLLYENIPGNIIEKKSYKENNYWVYDIKNKTKTNNAQHYRFYITPLEIITIIMGGEGDYVRRFETQIFDHITLKPYTNTWSSFNPLKGGFQLSIPDYHTIYGNKTFDKEYEDISIYGYDITEDANYLLLERTLSSKDILEDTQYELQRIQYEFYRQLDLDSTRAIFSHSSGSTQTQLGNKTLHLKTIINQNKYYLLATVGASNDQATKYFNSFVLKNLIATTTLQNHVDSSAYLSIKIPAKANEYLDFKFDEEDGRKNEMKNLFAKKHKSFIFNSPTGTTINLSFFERHKYEKNIEIDSIWQSLKKKITTDALFDDDNQPINKKTDFLTSHWKEALNFPTKNTNPIQLKNTIIRTDSTGTIHEYHALAVKKNSNQAIKYKALYSEGKSYLMKALVDASYKNADPFIESTFNSIQIINLPKKSTINDDKIKLFIEDALSTNDTIRYSALASANYLTIEKKDIPRIINFLKNFHFKKDETEALITLYRKLGAINHPTVLNHLKASYLQTNATTSVQFAILHALTQQKSKEGYSLIADLLAHDLPISNTEYDIQLLFQKFENDIPHSKNLYPAILSLQSIPEYHQAVISFVAKVLMNQKEKNKKLKPYKKTILTHANLEYKRLVSNKENEEENKNYILNSDESSFSKNLLNYLQILYPFKDNNDIKALYTKVNSLNIPSIQKNLALIEYDYTKNLSNQTVNMLLHNTQTKFIAYQFLHHTNQKNILYKNSDDSLALAGLNYCRTSKKDKEVITLFDKRIIEKNHKKIAYFFYKIKNIEENSINKNQESVEGIAFVLENTRINPQAYIYLKNEPFLLEQDIETYIRKTIDKSTDIYHPRANYTKN